MNLTIAEATQLKDSFKKAIKIIESIEPKGCESCSHWNNGCGLKGFETPPEHVKSHGCALIEKNEAPF